MSAGARAPEVAIRELRRGDERWLLPLRRENHEFLLPYEPARPVDFLTPEAQRTYVERSVRADSAAPFVILADGEPAGTANISNVVRGAFSSANVGYWVARTLNGRGVATRAVGLLAARAFGPLGLHRLEAGTLVDNVASQRVLTKNGFRPIGVSRRYLHIGGTWRDHLLFARTVEDDTAVAVGQADPSAEVREAAPPTPRRSSRCSPRQPASRTRGSSRAWEGWQPSGAAWLRCSVHRMPSRSWPSVTAPSSVVST